MGLFGDNELSDLMGGVRSLLQQSPALQTLAQNQPGTPQQGMGDFMQQAVNNPFAQFGGMWGNTPGGAFADPVGLSINNVNTAVQEGQNAYNQAHMFDQPKPQQGGKGSAPGYSGSGGGGDFGGSGSADDNAGLTGDQVNQFVASKFANSPLAGHGQEILSIANQYGIPVQMLLGIAWKESGMGTNVGAGNIFGITDPNTDTGLGGPRSFQHFANPMDEVRAAASNLASDTYRGKDPMSQIGAWYVGPQEYAAKGASATDHAGNGTVADYYNTFIAPTYQALGGRRQTTAPQQQGAGLANITPGVNGSIMQEFGPTAYAQANQSTYHYGTAYGLGEGQHPGVDWAVPAGTRVATPLGGTVTYAGGTGYYTDTMHNVDPAHSGEYMVTLDNGDQLILGHLSNITAQAGQRVNPGDLIGASGGSDGDHVHVEYRQRQADGSYRIIDPRTVLGQGGGGGRGLTP